MCSSVLNILLNNSPPNTPPKHRPKGQDKRRDDRQGKPRSTSRPKRLHWRGGVAYYVRRVPKRFAVLDPRGTVWISLGTDSPSEAVKKIAEIDAELEKYWAALEAAQSAEARSRRLGVQAIAQAHGFRYGALDELLAGDLGDVTRRLDHLKATEQTDCAVTVDAVMGTAERVAMPLSEGLEFFFAFTAADIRKKSPDQLRRWKNPRRKVIGHLIDVVGDKDMATLERADFLAFRQHLLDQITAGDLLPETANKYLSYLTAMVRTVAEAQEWDDPPCGRLRFKEGEERRRAPYPNDFIRTQLLAPGRLEGLNTEARRVLYAMVETGLRPSEIVNMAPENICLTREIPHVRVAVTATRDLKTQHAPREIPLLGVSLAAFQAQPRGFPIYRDKEAGLSGTINKFLTEQGLRPDPGQSLYSLRHSFEDRMIAAGADERMRTELMGHAYKREKYGRGPSLEMKHALLERMAFQVSLDV